MNIPTAIFITIIAAIIGSTGTFLLKVGSEKFGFNLKGVLFNFPLIIGIGFHGMGCVVFISALKHAPLSLLYPFASFSYIWAAFLSVKYLKERMNSWKWFGIVFILLGVSLIGLGSS